MSDIRVETIYTVHYSSGIAKPEDFLDFESAQGFWRKKHGNKHYLPGVRTSASIIKTTTIVEDVTPK